MHKKLLLLPLTAALLAACGSATPPAPVTLNTLTLGGVNSPLKIEAPAKLTVTAVSTDGNPFTGTATFTSSDPNVVAVAADGSLTVRHLSTRPVVLTVSEADKMATVSVTTYGLDFAAGTANGDKLSPGITFTIRFIDASGNGLPHDGGLAFEGPAGFNPGQPIIVSYPASLKTGSGQLEYMDMTAVSGQYTASLNADGVIYSKTVTLDAKSTLDSPSNVKAAATTQGVTVSGILPFRAARLTVKAYSNTSKAYVASTPKTGNLPSTLTWNTPIASGSYGLLFSTRSYFGTDNSVSGDPMPDQINSSYFFMPTVTVN